MVVSLIISLFDVYQSAPSADLIDPLHLKEPSWVLQRKVSSTRAMVSYRRRNDDSIFVISLRVLPSELTNSEWKVMTTNSAPDNRGTAAKFSPSTRSIGIRSFWSSSESGATIKTVYETYLIEVRISYSSNRINGKPVPVVANRVQDVSDLESAARHALARVMARDLQSAPNTNVAGRTIGDALRDQSGRVFVPLENWAEARGFALQKNIRAGTFSFTYRGQITIMALASDEWTMGTNRGNLGAFVLRRDNNWYVPLSSIQSAFP